MSAARKPAAASLFDKLRAPSPSTGGRKSLVPLDWLGAIVILVAGTIAFAPALRGDWVWDDDAEIVQNAVIKDPGGLGKIWRGEGLTDYFPLKSTVQWVQWRLWQDARVGYHVTNLALHLISALLVWRVLARLGLRCAWLGGLIFTLHPITVESVAWIAELKNVLSLPPLLLALDHWISFEQHGRRRDHGLAVALFAVAMLCKTSVVALPVFLLLFAWWRRGRIERKDFVSVLPLFAIAFALGLVTVWFQTTRAIGSWDIPSGGPFERIGRAGQAVLFYFTKCLLPAGLLPLYPRDAAAGPALLGWLAWVGVGGVAFVCWRWRATWGRHALLGLGWFILNLAPVIGLIDMAYLHFAWVADHFVYVPLIGLIGLAVAVADVSWRHAQGGRLAIAGAAAAIAIGALVQARGHAALYQGEAVLWRHVLQRTPDSAVAHNNLATALIRERAYAEALEHADAAIRAQPDYADAHFTRAAALVNLGRVDDAQAAVARLRDGGRRGAELHLKLGAAMLQANRVAEAIPHYESALRAVPNWAQAHKDFAVALYLAGRAPEALDHYDRGLRLEPDAQTHSNYGVALAAAGRVPDAIQQYERALRLQPGHPEAQYNYGIALAATGRLTEARAQFEAALRTQPGRAELHFNLGRTLQQLGQPAAAETEFREALRLNPRLREAAQQLEVIRRGAAPP